jgi:hypothetical protein
MVNPAIGARYGLFFPVQTPPSGFRIRLDPGVSGEIPEENGRYDPGVADVPVRTNDRSTFFVRYFFFVINAKISRVFKYPQ